MYRLVQESLTNTIKHAQATRARVKLRRHNGTAQCIVADDGIGFDVESVKGKLDTGCLGLLGMEERLEEIGGHLQINACPGEGTEIRFIVPLKRDGSDSRPPG